MNKNELEDLVRKILLETLSKAQDSNDTCGVIAVRLPHIKLTEKDRLDTGKSGDMVWTHDVFSLSQSPRLGCGLMEMKETTFNWHLDYDEIDYVIDGHLDIIINGKTVSADPGQIILIPKGSSIAFSVPDFARFLYVTYPADWQNQKK